MSDGPGECPCSLNVTEWETPISDKVIKSVSDAGESWKVEGDPVWTQHPTEDGVHWYDRVGR